MRTSLASLEKVVFCLGRIALLAATTTGARAGDEGRGQAVEDPPGEQRSRPNARVPWTTSRVAGSPDPALPYIMEPAFPKLTFEQPVVLAQAPGSDRLFVGELKGRILSFPNHPGAGQADVAIELRQSHPDLGMFYGLAFHPRFAENGYLYVCYMLRDGQPDGARVSRFKVTRDDPPQIDASTEEVLITWLAGGHDGGCLAFGPDGYLYISTGDAASPSPPDPLDTGQDLDDLLSCILRIDVDQRDPGKAYRIPPDNPFVATEGARGEIWAFGFRNPWRFSFDRSTGALWVGDVGWELWEMIDRVERGGNYGWSIFEGRQPVRPEARRGPGPILPPVVTHPHSEAASVTGGYVYHGARLKELAGVYIYGDFQTGKVWGLRHDGQKVTWHRELAATPLQLVSFGEDRDGELYALDYERTKQIYRLAPNPAASQTAPPFPRRLSETGLFRSTRDHAPAPGVIPYRVIAEPWSDHAHTERMFAVPGALRIGVDGRTGRWSFPDGSVVAKTISLDLEEGDPRSRRRIETQLLHREAGSWRAYTYLWDKDQADAMLADSQGATRTFTVRDPRAPDGRRVQEYRISSRAECLLCHNPWVTEGLLYGRQSASILGLNARQLDRDHDSGGRVDNPLRALEHIGLFSDPPNAGPSNLPKLVDPYDESADRARRARSYLQVNCAHCHQNGAGGTATIALTDLVPLSEMKALDIRPTQGAFGIHDARIIAPGDPEGSVLYYRMAKLGGGRMPRVGSHEVDEKALELIYDWIARMPRSGNALSVDAAGAAALEVLRTGASTPAVDRARAIERLAGSTRGALALMRFLDLRRGTEMCRQEIVARMKNHPGSEVRDLFERFLPPAERAKRLGEQVQPEAILALKGDATRGKDVFFAESSHCKNCHQVAGAGEALGPDLSKVGAKYTKAELIRQILEPSRTIEPLYQTYLLETTAGQVLTGLLVERSAQEVALKDATRKVTRVRTEELERLAPQAGSLMPDAILRDFTLQQAADLLEFLAEQK